MELQLSVPVAVVGLFITTMILEQVAQVVAAMEQMQAQGHPAMELLTLAAVVDQAVKMSQVLVTAVLAVLA
jgi:hypothetical protein